MNNNNTRKRKQENKNKSDDRINCSAKCIDNTSCGSKAIYKTIEVVGTNSKYLCQRHKDISMTCELIENEEQRKKRLKKGSVKYMKFSANERLMSTLNNDIMTVIITLFVNDDIYNWTFLRRINKLWKKYIEHSIKKPIYCMLPLTLEYVENRWSRNYLIPKEVKTTRAAYVDYICNAFKIETDNNRVCDQFLFIFFSPRKNEKNKNGKMSKEFEKIINLIIIKNIKGSNRIYPKQSKIAREQYNDIETLKYMLTNASNLY
jgi:hypothetical protein